MSPAESMETELVSLRAEVAMLAERLRKYEQPGQKQEIPEPAVTSPSVPLALTEPPLTPAEAALWESQERFRATFELAAVGIAHVDMTGKWIRVNRRFREIAGYSEAELRTLRFPEITHPDDVERDLEQTRALVAGRIESFSMEKRYIRKSGGSLWINMTVSLVRGRDGAPSYFIAVVEDIEERKRAAAEIAMLNAKLQRAMTETHHRIKNNLQIITALVNMQVLQHANFVPTSELTRIMQHIQALAHIHDLLTHQSKSSAQVDSLSVRQVLEKIKPMLQEMPDGRRIEANAEEILLPIQQSTALAILINELVSNAIKHGAGDINVRFVVADEIGMLEVSDAGPGFPAGFDPSIASNTGLELVDSLVSWDLQGSIRYDNRPQGGGRVVVRFPISLAQPVMALPEPPA